jgi:hypothetical protein
MTKNQYKVPNDESWTKDYDPDREGTGSLVIEGEDE